MKLFQNQNRKRAFLSFEKIKTVNPKEYEKVFDGDVRTQNLEMIFCIFNNQHPEGYTGRSMSVSDVVELNGKYYFCDSHGFVEISFDENKIINSK